MWGGGGGGGAVVTNDWCIGLKLEKLEIEPVNLGLHGQRLHYYVMKARTLNLQCSLFGNMRKNKLSQAFPNLQYMSHVVRKLDFCLCENKDADQLCSNCTADQCLCFCYSDSITPLLLI